MRSDPAKVRAWRERSARRYQQNRAPRKPLPKRSERTQARVSARRAAVAAALARDGGCVAAGLVPSVACWGPLDGHEPLTRARGGDPCDPDNVITLCRCHHDWAHGHPAEATALGLLRSAA